MSASTLPFASVKNTVCLALSVLIVSASLAMGAFGIQSLEMRATISQVAA